MQLQQKERSDATASMPMLKAEHHLIAFEPAELPPGPWLVFAPHADDETFGMGGSLIKAHAAGIETHVVVLTDGALGGNAKNLVAIRRDEVARATQILGVKSLQCWSEPDRNLAVTPAIVDRISQTITAIAPQSIFFPGPMELHPDHRAAALLVWKALQSARPSPAATALFSYEISVQNPTNMMIDITAQISIKEQAMAVYASQNGMNSYPELVMALDKARTFSLPSNVSHAEAFYKYAPEDLQYSLAEVLHAQIDKYLAQAED